MMQRYFAFHLFEELVDETDEVSGRNPWRDVNSLYNVCRLMPAASAICAIVMSFHDFSVKSSRVASSADARRS